MSVEEFQAILNALGVKPVAGVYCLDAKQMLEFANKVEIAVLAKAILGN